MDFLKTAKSAFGLGATLAILAGCGGGHSGPVPGGPAAGSSVQPQSVRSGKREQSWIAPGAQRQPSLLYVSNAGSGDVTIYTYFNGGGLLLVGTISGFSLPTGMCTDNDGNVWIPDFGTGRLYEYAHGGTTPIATIKQRNERPYDCSVDPATGNLAVANQRPNGKYSYGNVTVYPNGSHRGTAYVPANGFSEVDFLAYDNKSDLFVDGAELYGQPALFELPKAQSTLTQLSLSGATLGQPGAVNWVKPYLLLGDQNFEGRGTSGAYKVYVSGTTGTVVGTLAFQGTRDAYGFWRRAGMVVVPDHVGSAVRIYTLANGILESKLTRKIALPFGAVVSQGVK